MRDLKKKLLDILQDDGFFQKLEAFCTLPGRRIVNPLFSFLLHPEERIRWRAVTAMGKVVGHLADHDMESARVIMRRLMWSLNDESGGIGWGAPESMGEIIATHEGLAKEYAHVLISYIWEEGNYLEYDILQRGALWAVGRAAKARPEYMKKAIPHLVPFLRSSDDTVRGLAARALGFLDPEPGRRELERLLEDSAEVSIYENGQIKRYPIKDLAQKALKK